MPTISVIVPVYNVEKYLSRCIDSILNQTFSDFELILVDDGSTDNSGKICDEYAKSDNRIIVKHIPNGGVSNARNTGIDIAIGDFITFIDSDDWIANIYLAVLYKNLTDYNADISVCSMSRCCSIENEPEHTTINIKLFNKRDAIEYFGTLNNEKFRAPFVKLIKSKLVKMNTFPKNRKFAEDMAVVYRWYFNADKIVECDIPLYYYNINDASVTKKKYGLFRLGNLETLEELLSFFDNNNFEELYIKFMHEYLYDLYSQYMSVKNELQDDILAKELLIKLKTTIKINKKRCNISIKKDPYCFNILYPNTMKLYWTFMGISSKLKRGTK